MSLKVFAFVLLPEAGGAKRVMSIGKAFISHNGETLWMKEHHFLSNYGTEFLPFSSPNKS